MKIIHQFRSSIIPIIYHLKKHFTLKEMEKREKKKNRRCIKLPATEPFPAPKKTPLQKKRTYFNPGVLYAGQRCLRGMWAFIDAY